MRKFRVVAALGLALVAMALVLGPHVTRADPVPGDGANTFDVTPTDSGQVGIGGGFSVDINLVGEPTNAELQYSGAAWQLEWTDTEVDYVSNTPGPLLALPGPATVSTGTPPGTEEIVAGGIQAAPTFAAGKMWTVGLKCAGLSSGPDRNADLVPDTDLTLVSIATDPINGSATALVAGSPQPMVLQSGFVTCLPLADLVIEKTDSPDPVLAGGTLTYTVTMHNNGPNPAHAAILADLMPPEKIIGGTPGYVANPTFTVPFPSGVVVLVNGVPYSNPMAPPCVDTIAFGTFDASIFGFGIVHNLVLVDFSGSLIGLGCGPTVINPSDLVVMTITSTVPLTDAGKANFNVVLSGNLVEDDPHPEDEADCPPPGVPPFNLPATPANSVGCELTHVSPALVTVSKVGVPDPANAGQTITWTVSVGCGAGGSPCSNATGLKGPVIADTVSTNQVTINDVYLGAGPGPDANCTTVYPSATCTIPAVMAPGTSQTMTVKTTVDPNLPAVAPCTDHAVVTYADPATVTADKSVVCQPVVVEIALDKGAWAFPGTITLLNGSSTIVDVVEQIEIIKPGLSPNLLHSWLAFSSGIATFDWQEEVDTPNLSTPVASSQTLGFMTGPWPVPTMFTITKHLNVMCNAVGQDTVHLSLAMVAGNAPANSVAALTVNCVASPSETKVPNQGNLWIMRHPNCVDDDHDGKIDEDPMDTVDNDGDGVIDEDPGPCNPYQGKGSLVINEVGTAIDDVDSPNDADLDKEGLAAYEKQVKFDHKLVSLEVEDAGFLGSTGRSVNCNLTIVTENWVLFGCVSTGTQNGPISAVPVTLSRIWVTPATDLIERIRPTKDNGVVTPLLDENCEWADKYGDPMAGTINGGLVPVCGDATVTIRMLEGDLNLDCNVDVLDEQGIAFRYGSSFGLLLYDQWFDLEPKLSDFDIDIKDLQFVFGRDGSTCQVPIPLQPPSPPVP